MKRILIALALVLLAPMAQAHALRVFAADNGQEIYGYGFFIGGGRPVGAEWVAKDSQGTIIASGQTGPDGEFSLPRTASPVTIVVNSGDGHLAQTTLGGTSLPASPPPSGAIPFVRDTQATYDQQAIDTAIAQQMAPLLDRIEQMDTRMRLTDMMSGLFLIIGLVGIGLWARGRRK